MIRPHGVFHASELLKPLKSALQFINYEKEKNIQKIIPIYRFLKISVKKEYYGNDGIHHSHDWKLVMLKPLGHYGMITTLMVLTIAVMKTIIVVLKKLMMFCRAVILLS